MIDICRQPPQGKASDSCRQAEAQQRRMLCRRVCIESLHNKDAFPCIKQRCLIACPLELLFPSVPDVVY